MSRTLSTNPRLERTYRTLEHESRSTFLANDLHVDTVWGQPVWGVALQVDLGEQVKDLVCSYQKSLNALDPGAFLLLPREHQHISVNQVVFWGGTYELGRERTWEGVREQFMRDFSCLDGLLPAFDVSFRDLVATRDAIILCGYDSDDHMQRLRNTLQRELSFPAETTKRNEIIHTTVARYRRKLSDPMGIWNYVVHQRGEATMTMARIFLRAELVFPSLLTRNLAEIDLARHRVL